MANAEYEFEADEELKNLKSPRQRQEEKMEQLARQNQAKAKKKEEIIDIQESDIVPQEEEAFAIDIDTNLMINEDELY